MKTTATRALLGLLLLSAAVPALAQEPAELQFPTGEAFRAKKPVAGPVRPLDVKPPERFRLPNGIDVLLVERHSLPFVEMRLVLDGGSGDDPAGKEGLAALSMDLLSAGTTTLDRVAFAEALADLGAEITPYAGLERLAVSMNTLSRNLDPTLDLLADLLLRPALAEAELEKNRKQAIAAVQKAKGAPGSVANRLRRGVVFGPSHPLGRVSGEASLAGITRDDCRRWLEARLRPQGARLYVVGDVTKAQLLEKLPARLAGWTGRPAPVTRGVPPAPPRGKIFVVDMPGAPQSSVAILHPGPTRQAPDWVETTLVANILGGDFTSRINMNIREKNGYAYGARGRFDYLHAGSIFSAGGSIRTDATAAAIEEIFREIDGIRTAPVTAEEIEREKSAEILGLPGRFDTGSSTLATWEELVEFGLPADTWTRHADRVKRATPAGLLAAAKKHIAPASAKILVVGDASKVMPKLVELAEKRKIAPRDVVRLDVDGKVIPPAVKPPAKGSAPAATK